jgi:hydrogenase nickel incorporation protein HypA/HybF
MVVAGFGTAMHELSIALSLIEVATEQIARRNLAQVEVVHLRLGELSGVVADALLFSFDVATAGTALEGARLEIERVPVSVHCRRCDAERELPSIQRLQCPSCGDPTPDVRRGREIELFALEVRSDVRDESSAAGGSARGSAAEERPSGS